MITPLSRRTALVLFPVLLMACTAREGAVPPAGGNWTLDSATASTLPQLQAADGRLLCVADGTTPCPAGQPYANRLDAERIALWEPGRPVQLWGADSTPIDVGAVGAGLGEYQMVLAVGPGKDGEVLVVDMAADDVRLMRFDRSGKFLELSRLPPLLEGEARGFAGKIPLQQAMVARGDSGGTDLRVTVLDDATKSTGRVVLEVPIPWLSLQGSDLTSAPPLFVAAPTYVMTTDGEIIWSPGDRLEIVRRMADGSPRWQLRGDLPRAPVTPQELAARRASARRAMGEQATEADLDTMVARSDMKHPAVAGLIATPEGVVYVAGPATAADSVDYLRLAADGKPNGRFRLSQDTRFLLAIGDSILVQRPHAGEPREIRWLRLTAP